MIPFILYSILAVLTLISLNNRKIGRKMLFCICLVAFVLTGIRWEYGGDWGNYTYYFNHINGWKFRFDDNGYEFGWVIISTIVKQIFNSYVAFQFVIASVIFYCVYKCFTKLSPYPVLSYLILFSTVLGGIGYIRTILATIIIIYSYVFVVERKIFPFLLVVTFAGMIHYSAFIALPLYWIYKINIKYKTWLIIFIVSVSLFYIYGKMYFSSFSFLGPYIEYKINKYIMAEEDGGYFQGSMTMEKAIANQIIKKCFAVFSIIVFCGKDILKDKIFKGLFNIYLFSVVFYCSVVPMASQFGRMGGYFECVDCIIYAYIYYYIKNPTNRWAYFFLLFVFSTYRLYSAIAEIFYLYDYKTIFN